MLFCRNQILTLRIFRYWAMSRFSKLYYFPIYLALALIVGMVIGRSLPKGFSATVGHSSKSDSLANEMYNLSEMLELVKEHYVDSVDVTKIAQRGINDLLKQLDPHSAYVPSAQVDKMNESLKGSFEGIGMEFTLFKDTIVVVKPVIGGPSEQAGLQPGDKIIQIEGKNAAGTGMNSDAVIKKLRGKRGTVVHISVLREVEKALLPFAIIRAEIPIHSVVAAFMLDSTTAYFKIEEFAENTIKELQESAPYANKNVKNVVVDLRYNGGGYLNTCFDLADEFLKEGELVVYTDDRMHQKKKMFATEKGQFENAKVYVLINSESASASEIFAGAIQDNDRGVLIGERTFGKGLVQEVFPLADGGQMRLTVSRYYTPSGRCIQREYKGVDYEAYSSERFDEAKTDSSKVFYTKNKRKVYASGGVSPDVVLAPDSVLQWSLMNKIYEEDFIRKAALFYYLKHKQQLKALPPHVFLQSIAVQADIRRSALASLSAMKLISKPLNAASTAFLAKEVCAIVAKCAYESNAYYNVLLQNDPYIRYVLQQLKHPSLR